ncbi:hypothetical protein BMT54_11920 [Pasteurellaceae bacterium 15-036681]|nr:hypothetical protein BMT54_11920 [Pasteurellaceae bacterium 15-036681]
MADFGKYIYLDSKIIGAAKQIVAYFEQGIFSKKDTVVLVKKYKHKSAKQIARIFSQYRLMFRFVRMRDLDHLGKGVIFYPFNAQSNVRAVANRKLKHIFITHGESNKIASIKPIIRIYDYIVTAGQAGIDRFIANGIFSSHDVEHGRFIKMGDTFIGQTGLAQPDTGKACLFYAPTWEGGIEQENYSSLENISFVMSTLCELARQYDINEIVIRPHPNMGHRLKIYRQHLLELIKLLSMNGFSIVIFSRHFTFSWLEKLKLRRYKIQSLDDLSHYYARFGVCDISAMESQLLNEDIPYHLYWNSFRHPSVFVDASIYEDTQFIEGSQKFITLVATQIRNNRFKDYLIDQHIKSSQKTPIAYLQGIIDEEETNT